MKKPAIKRKFRSYEEVIKKDLQDPEYASAYLNMALMDKNPRIFLIALSDVCQALDIPAEELPETAQAEPKSLSGKRNKVLSKLVSLIRSGHASLSLTLSKK